MSKAGNSSGHLADCCHVSLLMVDFYDGYAVDVTRKRPVTNVKHRVIRRARVSKTATRVRVRATAPAAGKTVKLKISVERRFHHYEQP